MQKTPVRFLDQKIRWRRNRLPTPVFLGFPCGSAGKESTCNAGDLGSIPGLGPWRRGRLPTPVFLGFPCDSVGKESACNAGDLGSTPGLGRSPKEGKVYPLQYSGLEISMDEIGPGCSLEGMMLKLNLQYFGHLMRRVDSLEKTLMLGGIWGGREGDDRG